MKQIPLSIEYEKRINRARKLSWICEAFAVLFLSIGFVLCVTLMRAASQVQVLSQLIPKDMQASEDFVFSDAINQDMLFKLELDELLVRRFIMLRHENFKDEASAMLRVGPRGELASLTAPWIYRDFAKQYTKAADAEDLPRIYTQQPRSTVEFKKVTRSQDVWQVEFDKVFPGNNGQIVRRVPYTAALVVSHIDDWERLTSELANPLGFIIGQYDERIQK